MCLKKKYIIVCSIITLIGILLLFLDLLTTIQSLVFVTVFIGVFSSLFFFKNKDNF